MNLSPGGWSPLEEKQEREPPVLRPAPRARERALSSHSDLRGTPLTSCDLSSGPSPPERRWWRAKRQEIDGQRLRQRLRGRGICPQERKAAPPAPSRHEPAGLGKAFSILNTGRSTGAKTPFDLGVVASLITGEAFRQLPPLTGPQDFMKKSPILNDSGSFWTSQPELASLPFFVLEVDIYEPWPALGTRVQMPAPQVAQPAHCSQQRPWADPEP